MHVARKARLHSFDWLLGVGVVAAAACGGCSDDPDRDKPSMLPLPESAPLLACERKVASDSSCQRASDCAADEFCRADDAAMQEDRASLLLTCGKAVGSGQNRDRCESSADCETGICGLSDVCLLPCASSADCLEGQACRRVEARIIDGLSPLMACARTLAFADDVTISAPKVRKVVGESVSTLEIAASEENALVYLYLGCEAQGEVRALRHGASDWFVLDELLGGRREKNPIINVGSLIPVLVPNNPALKPREAFELDLYSDLATELRVVTVARAGEHEVLDFNIYYVGGGEQRDLGGLRPGSRDIRAIFRQMDERLRPYGLRIGELREHDVPGALRDELSVLETELIRDEQGNAIDIAIHGLDELFQLSAGSDDGGVNLFLLSDMGDVLGISGGIPGALGVSGTAASGVALAVDVIGLEELANVALHEVSHQLGLFHTSEFNGFVTEPLDDTPTCRLDRDQNGDGILVSSECVGAGAENLMFWEGTGAELSDQQAEILRRSPVLR
jgi:hypothetical protein